MGERRRLAVVGNGITGAVVAAGLASIGHRVVAVETDPGRRQALQRARLSVFEPGLSDLLLSQQWVGRLSVVGDVGDAVADAAMTFLCVDDRSRSPRDGRTERLAETVGEIGKAAGALHPVVVATAMPLGPGAPLRKLIDRSLGADERTPIVSFAGFLREGRALADFLTPDSIVLGGESDDALRRVVEVLRPIFDQSHPEGDWRRRPDVITTDLATAEGIKRAVAGAVTRTVVDLRTAEEAEIGATALPRAVGFDGTAVASPSVMPGNGSGNGSGHTNGNGNGHRRPVGPLGRLDLVDLTETSGPEISPIVRIDHDSDPDQSPTWKRPHGVASRPADPTVTVVIPTLNEAENLPHVVRRLPRMVSEVVIVDGRSTDDTVAVAKELMPDCVVVLEDRPGKGVALRSGFEAATGDIVVMIDADGSTDPAEIPSFVGTLIAGADFVKGSRFMQGGGTDDMELHRKLGNWGITQTVNVAFGGRFSDLCYGYNAMWRDAIPQMDLDCDGFEIETLMGIRALRAGLEIAEVPSFECPRIHGSSNLSALRDGLRILRTIIRERLRPFRKMPQTRPAIPAVRPVPAGVRSLLSMIRMLGS